MYKKRGELTIHDNEILAAFNNRYVNGLIGFKYDGVNVDQYYTDKYGKPKELWLENDEVVEAVDQAEISVNLLGVLATIQQLATTALAVCQDQARELKSLRAEIERLQAELAKYKQPDVPRDKPDGSRVGS